jgi:HlyD family secretion protein
MTAPNSTAPDAGFSPSPARGGGGKWALLLLLVLAAGGGTWYYLKNKPATAATQFRTVPVARGEIVQEVTANGSLSPVKNVEVGSQVSGIIDKIAVDFNSLVKEGDLLAQIDPSTYQQNLIQAEAELANAAAGLELAEINAKRAQELFKNKLISAAEHDSTQAAYHQAQATLKTREASVFRAKVDLSRTTITAPISGVVISRAVDQGQTVAASFNTPKLFVIANDLTKMQIEAAVSEADVGGVEEGQKVSFSVEAFQNRKFSGRLQQVRFAPITNQNVVTYTAVVQVDNSDLKLRPGMTATAKIITAQKSNVLRVPNAALRFRPPPGVTVLGPTNSAAGGSTNRTASVAVDSDGNPIPPWRAESRRPNPGEREKFEASLTPEQRERYQQMVQQMRQRFAEGGGGPGGPGGGGGAGGGAPRRPDGPTTATVYLLEGAPGSESNGKASLKPVTVKAGITDGSFTEILDGLKEGDLVVTGTSSGAAGAAAEPPRNPFMPFGGGGGRR